MLDGLGIATGVDVHALAQASGWVSREIGHAPPRRVARALAGREFATRPQL